MRRTTSESSTTSQALSFTQDNSVPRQVAASVRTTTAAPRNGRSALVLTAPRGGTEVDRIRYIGPPTSCRNSLLLPASPTDSPATTPAGGYPGVTASMQRWTLDDGNRPLLRSPSQCV